MDSYAKGMGQLMGNEWRLLLRGDRAQFYLN